MNGLAITIIVGQLPKLCGFSTDADDFVDEVREFVTNFDERDATALAVGLATLAVLLVLPRTDAQGPGGAGRRGRRHGRLRGLRLRHQHRRHAARRAARGRPYPGPTPATSCRCSSPRWVSRSSR